MANGTFSFLNSNAPQKKYVLKIHSVGVINYFLFSCIFLNIFLQKRSQCIRFQKLWKYRTVEEKNIVHTIFVIKK